MTQTAVRTGFERVAQATDVVKTFGSGDDVVTALRGVSAEFRRGQFTAIMGPSGSGKSAFLRCLAGLDTVTSGQVRIGGTDLTRLSRHKLTRLRRARLGFVFQSGDLMPMLTAEQNIRLAARLAGRRVDADWFGALADALGLRDRLRQRPSELSGGRQQAVAVARALVTRPEVVFADEPTGDLGTRSAHELLRFLRATVDGYGQTIVMVTQDPEAAAYADRVLVLNDGKIENEWV